MGERPRLTPATADARRAVRVAFQQAQLAAQDTVLLAVSGGGDSMALAAAAAFEAPRAGLTVTAGVVDHGLQPESAQVAQQAAARLRALGLAEVDVVRVNVQISGEGIESAARDARYQALEQLRQKHSASFMLLGHNLEDQAETVLLGLARGSGLRSIAGMPEIDLLQRRLRPFLGLTRASLRQACADQGVEFWDDPHNTNSDFTRVRARALLVDLERELGPGFAEALSRTAAQARATSEYLDGQASVLVAQAQLSSTARSQVFSVEPLAGAPIALRRAALHLISQRVGARNLNQAQLLTVEALLTDWHGQKFVPLSGITVERDGPKLTFTATQPPTSGAC